MCGTTFWQMENALLMSLTALLLLGVRIGIASPDNSSHSSTFNFSQVYTTSLPIVKETPCTKPHNITQLVLGLLKIEKVTKSQCEGDLYIEYPNKVKTYLCLDSQIPYKWTELCERMGCGEFIKFKKVTDKKAGLILTSDMALKNDSTCQIKRISCKEVSNKELAAYKAVTGILIFLILAVILLHFSRPTYKTIRKRFSQKRQSRWIGPTQSQSVSYHRGQGPPNNNTVKRQSYPGLERLTVSTSREPSSNRNSDYDSYGYN